MKWPWVSRAQVDVRDREISFLTREVDFWRDKFEIEKERADRGVDSALEAVGREPISAPARAEVKAVTQKSEDFQKQIMEIFGDVSASLTEDDKDTQKVSQSASESESLTSEAFEAEKNRRLSAISAANAIRFPSSPESTEESEVN